MILQTNNHLNPEKLSECQLALGYSFHDPITLEKALTHTSCRLENNFSNERLEFLGDAVLGMIISDYLYKTLPQCSEGELTKIKSVVVKNSSRSLEKLFSNLQEVWVSAFSRMIGS